jgi:hypothetical protein
VARGQEDHSIVFTLRRRDRRKIQTVRHSARDHLERKGEGMRYNNERFVTMILAGLLAAGLAACTAGEKASHAVAQAGQTGGPSGKRLSLGTDPRIELLAVVQHFTSWAGGGHIKSETAYKDDIERYFAEFKYHTATACVESLLDAGFTHDAPVAFMLYHGDPPGLAQRAPYSDYLIGRAKGKENLLELADALRDFARETDFMRFYQAHSALYGTQAAEVDSLLSGKDYVQAIEDFYGQSRKSYGLVLSPLFAGGYGITVDTGEGYDIYGVIGPCALKGDRTSFACLGYVESIMLHEWSHSFVNPLVDQNMDIFGESAGLFVPIKDMMRRQAYPTWKISLYEHIVRACEIYLRDRLHRDLDSRKLLESQEGKGFWYVTHIDSMLDIYTTHRDEYPAFDRFVPVIATSLMQIAIDDLPARITTFSGPLSATFPRAPSRIYLVYPTGVSEDLAGEIKEELRRFGVFISYEQIEPLLLSDMEALDIDWQDNVAFIYGNASNNTFLQRLKLGIPLVFRDEAIEFGGKTYEGPGIVLISCMQNPHNKRLPFVLCATNKAEDLIGAGSRIGSAEEWDADYVIYRGGERLKTGHYQKGEAGWSLASRTEQD